MDKDFSLIQFKINVSGSWANLVNCHVDHYEQVKDACETLAQCHGGSINFKALDAEGGLLELYTYKNGRTGWITSGGWISSASGR